jgi:hypothetical protein
MSNRAVLPSVAAVTALPSIPDERHRTLARKYAEGNVSTPVVPPDLILSAGGTD